MQLPTGSQPSLSCPAPRLALRGPSLCLLQPLLWLLGQALQEPTLYASGPTAPPQGRDQQSQKWMPFWRSWTLLHGRRLHLAPGRALPGREGLCRSWAGTVASQGGQEESPQCVGAPEDWGLAGTWAAGGVRLPVQPRP